ncbi:coiled-coil domain-containing protein 127a [Polypterus senegalus]
MNNLNDPPRWNIQPDQQGDGGGNKWNYAFLVPMLGLAAFRWIWSRESQREVLAAKIKYEEDAKLIKKELEMKYSSTVTETRRTVAHLELELEKERSRVKGYRDALVSQSRQLIEERKRLQEDRESIDREKQQLLHSGAAAALYNNLVERETNWQSKAMLVIKEFENVLVERQNAFCSFRLHRDKRYEIERSLLVKAATEPVAVDLNIESDLKTIFRHDKHCADILNTDKRKNGRLMWLYLKYWELQVELQKFKKVEKSILGANYNAE